MSVDKRWGGIREEERILIASPGHETPPSRAAVNLITPKYVIMSISSPHVYVCIHS